MWFQLICFVSTFSYDLSKDKIILRIFMRLSNVPKIYLYYTTNLYYNVALTFPEWREAWQLIVIEFESSASVICDCRHGFYWSLICDSFDISCVASWWPGPGHRVSSSNTPPLTLSHGFLTSQGPGAAVKHNYLDWILRSDWHQLNSSFSFYCPSRVASDENLDTLTSFSSSKAWINKLNNYNGIYIRHYLMCLITCKLNYWNSSTLWVFIIQRDR